MAQIRGGGNPRGVESAGVLRWDIAPAVLLWGVGQEAVAGR